MAAIFIIRVPDGQASPSSALEPAKPPGTQGFQVPTLLFAKTMRQTSIILLLVFVVAAPALAQRRAPSTGMVGIGASVGAALPTEDNLENGLELAGNVEGYLTPRVSIRAQLGTAWLDFGDGRTARPLFVDGNIVYNWEGGQWHPYVTGGVGYYRYAVKDGPNDNNAGFDLGAGFEYFFTRRSTLTAELLYHKVGDVIAPPLEISDGSFWTVAIGAKTYLGR
jgi:Outer membrane protein beta-barrel domain